MIDRDGAAAERRANGDSRPVTSARKGRLEHISLLGPCDMQDPTTRRHHGRVIVSRRCRPSVGLSAHTSDRRPRGPLRPSAPGIHEAGASVPIPSTTRSSDRYPEARDGLGRLSWRAPGPPQDEACVCGHSRSEQRGDHSKLLPSSSWSHQRSSTSVTITRVQSSCASASRTASTQVLPPDRVTTPAHRRMASEAVSTTAALTAAAQEGTVRAPGHLVHLNLVLVPDPIGLMHDSPTLPPLEPAT